MEPRNEGQRLLSVALEPRGEAAKLAKKASVTPGTVSRWLSGEKKPDTSNRFLIARLHGVPVLSWDEPAEEAPGDSAA